MIASQDRSGYFGASDVKFITGNWNTKTWMEWYLEKLGIPRKHIVTPAMSAGTHWEHRILDAIDPLIEKDKQIIVEDLLLRVNYDGTTEDTDHEVKTYSFEKKFNAKQYYQQVQVQMFAGGYRKAKIHAYGLIAEEYDNYFLPVDLGRLQEIPVGYDPQWIEAVFLPKISRLSVCLREGRIPEEVLMNGNRNGRI